MPKRTELVLEGQEGHDQDIISYLDSELEIGDSKLAQEVRAQIKEKASGVFMWVVLVSGILQQKKHGIGRSFRFNTTWGLSCYILQDDDLIVASFAIASSKAYTYINFRTPRGEIPFSVAIQHSHYISATLGFLIENGARIESRDQLRRTPLCLAAANGDTAAVAFLLENGANVQKTCIHGKTPLPYAAGGGSEECMRLLISGGASVAATDDRGQTALFQAACSPNESEAKMQLLIGHGADVHRADNSGRTPLSHAARLGAKACQLLLDHGADVNAAGNRGRTPLSYAVSSYDPEAQKCVQLLLDRGAIPDIVDGTGNTALSNAATDTVRALLSISL
ncbi:hypothetical protein FOBRF1_012604 [Fusarium oxysporum]